MCNRFLWSLLFWMSATISVQAQQTGNEAAPAEATSQEQPPAEPATTPEPTPETLATLPVAALPTEASAVPPEKVVNTDLQEVLVTATRRKQSLNKTPIAITEVSGAALTAGVVRDTQSVQLVVPSLVVTLSGNEAGGGVIRIRGVGTPGTNAGLESSVGVFVDGVYLPRAGLAFSDLVDIERVEVLRGPQGTLFGKNTSSGAVNILTRRPSYTPQADLNLSGTTFNGYLARGIFSGPIIDDKLAYRFSAQLNKRDGYIHNLFDGKDYNNRNRYSLRGQLQFDPSEDIGLRLIGGYYNRNERCCIAPYLINGPTTAQRERQGGVIIDPPSTTLVSFDDAKISRANEFNVSSHLDWNLGNAKAKLLLSYQKGFAEDPGEADFSDLSIVYFPFNKSYIASKTAELSFSGKFNRLDWVIGSFASHEDLDVRNSILLGDDAGEFVLANIINAPQASPVPGVSLPPYPVPPSTVVPIGLVGSQLYPGGSGQTLNQADQIGKNLSFFTHNVLDIGWDVNLTLGLRYLIEDKTGGGVSESNSPSCNIPQGTPGVPAALRVLCGAPAYRTSYNDTRVTGTGGLSKSFGNVFVYGSYSSGFKSGGLNLNPSSTTGGTFSFRPETVDAYELGIKAPFFGKKLSTRLAYFYMDFKDFQLNGFDGTAFIVSNAGAVVSRGVELEGTLNPWKPLRISGGVTYADVFFDDGTEDANLLGKQVTNAPRWTNTLSIDIKKPLPWAGMTFLSNVAGRYQSKINTAVSLAPQAEQEGYTLINGRVGLGFANDLNISVFGTNLTDKVYQSIIFASVSQAGSFNAYPGPRRTLGIELSKKF